MASFPRIESPCPLRLGALPSAGRDFCTTCERKVHNLSVMSEAERKTFMRSCTGKVCVAYSVAMPRSRSESRLGAGVGLAMLIGAGSALADGVLSDALDTAQRPVSLLTAEASDPHCDEVYGADDAEVETVRLMVMGGGISSPQDAQWIDADNSPLPEIPTVSADAWLEDAAVSVVFGADPAESKSTRR